jgi:hypothetical protein
MRQRIISSSSCHISPSNLHLLNPSEALGIGSNKETSIEAATPYNAVAHSKVRLAALRHQIKRVPWTPEENMTILEMKGDGSPWEEIRRALPHRTQGAIQLQYSTRLKK